MFTVTCKSLARQKNAGFGWAFCSSAQVWVRASLLTQRPLKVTASSLRHTENVPGSASAEPARSFAGSVVRKKARSVAISISKHRCRRRSPSNRTYLPRYPRNPSSCLGSVFNPSRSSTLPSVRSIATCPAAPSRTCPTDSFQ